MEEMVWEAATAKTAPEDLMITIRYNKGNFNYLSYYFSYYFLFTEALLSELCIDFMEKHIDLIEQ